MDAFEPIFLHDPAPAEPKMIEVARRTGWALLVVAATAMLAGRFGPTSVRVPAIVFATTASLFGLLAIVNVALVRGLYRQIGAMAPRPVDRTTTADNECVRPDAPGSNPH